MNTHTPHAGPRDILLNILASTGLYIIVIFFGVLVFQYINYFFPDPLAYDRIQSIRGALRWAISVLIVAFPIYLWINTHLAREIKRYSEKRELKTRKWLLYLTLFAAFLVIAGDMVALIYQFLEGEITIRFVLKVLAILLIAGAVFLYYGWNLKKEVPASRHQTMRFFVWGVVGIVATSVLGGFFIVGSPQSERSRQFDERRTGDLQSIQWQIINFWQAKNTLPSSLASVRDDISGYQSPVDPETREEYEYRVLGDLSFELCAVFNEASEDDSMRRISIAEPFPVKGSESWSHDKGRVCFERTIDPDLYPPRELMKN